MDFFKAPVRSETPLKPRLAEFSTFLTLSFSDFAAASLMSCSQALKSGKLKMTLALELAVVSLSRNVQAGVKSVVGKRHVRRCVNLPTNASNFHKH